MALNSYHHAARGAKCISLINCECGSKAQKMKLPVPEGCGSVCVCGGGG